MTIDEFARHMSTSARNVRAYQEKGLLTPPILVGRTGYYDETHVERFITVQRLQKEGFSLAAISALLDAWEAGDTLDDVVGARRSLGAASTEAMDTSTLFPVTKFQRPSGRAEHIRRTRCLEMIDGPHVTHVLITSPGGNGKSTLAAQLLDRTDGAPAWLSLERSDNEPGGFWTAFLIALRTALPEFGGGLLREIVGGADVDRVLVRLADTLDAEDTAVSVVLDDLHEITDVTVIRQLSWMLERIDPATCRVVMCSRTRPALPTAQLVMTGRLAHLETEDISFDGAETRELLLERLGVALTPEQADEIAAGTDGWAAAIYLSGLALRTGATTEEVLQSLSVPDRRVQDYFADEILHAITPRQLAFLEGISFLDRFTADLCDAVRDATDSEEILGELRGNMFVLRLDAIGFWQRLHHTFAAVLRARAAAAGNANLPLRQRRAADWLMAHDRIPEAIEYYVRAADYDDAVRVIAAEYPRFMNISPRGAAVERWLDMLPMELVTGSPELGLAWAAIAGARGEAGELHRRIEAVKPLSANDSHSQAIMDFLRGCFNFGEVEAGRECARSSFVMTPPTGIWYPMQGAVYALLATWVDGPTPEVLHVVEDLLALESTEHQPIALAGLWALRGLVQAAHGQCGAADSVRRAADIRREQRIDRVPQAANTWSSTARTHRLLGDVDQAAADALAGYEVVAGIPPERDAVGSVVPILVELVYARRLQGRTSEARRYADEAQRRLAGITGPGRFRALLAEAAAGL
ncbi:MerR family transcriptional regulator [Mycolicibacterium smegmatis]|uniref:MerR family transcriptional regulator n=1 Tax=Mycolicibacterium smegmatis TaxID=1772 RepID=UPI0009BDBEC5|nr:MerR family transcriptional regulator [Mycolicibacterium smegmatis]MDF1898371.1 MerR family transcriptional regulator [Mycolicibacterium smegmatis]MDF1906402.1 MerR family transcriptional regulator [Mycolicibacterium smegmatis]MDF1916446.1 MerR family transcriptional regulator [Mycolicibacterium smegmatis]MDF1922712.1 MerR family transcriptional regulator [Mycolicibacterium smegmatis]UAK56830.1 MerR family transcriptional regulator [Mycolicibacterium smegmatis]